MNHVHITRARKNGETICTNRKARYDYEIMEELEAGIVLTGSEVKACRHKSMSLSTAYIHVDEKEAILIGAEISTWEKAGQASHGVTRNRKLLLKKKEIDLLRSKAERKGLTVIPLKSYFNKKGLVKVKIALAKGKKLYDKREMTKKKESLLQAQRELNSRK